MKFPDNLTSFNRELLPPTLQKVGTCPSTASKTSKGGHMPHYYLQNFKWWAHALVLPSKLKKVSICPTITSKTLKGGHMP